MLLLLRKMKRDIFNRQEFRKYALYGAGELVLIVIGILIALQIDNWNSDKNQEESLRNYLDSIARNIRDDLVEVRAIREDRQLASELATWQQLFIEQDMSFTVDEISFSSYALVEAQRILFFDANMTGYDALKSSGSLEQLQGRDIEQLLYDYYDTVARITHAEESHNDYIRQLSLQVMADWPADLAQFEFSDPVVLAEDRFEAAQPAYRKLLHNPKINAMYGLAGSVGQLLLDYDKLDRLGRAFVHMTDKGTMVFDEAATALLDDIFDVNEGLGFAEILTDGRISLHTYGIGSAASMDGRLAGRSLETAPGTPEHPLRIDTVQQSDDNLRITYGGGVDWAAIFFAVRGSSALRPSLDFSAFDQLRLELKGNVAGETVSVHLKDSLDPDDGNQTNIEIELTDQWQTYTIDLDRFENADLTQLHVVTGFLFRQEPKSFSIRSIRFAKAD